MMGRRVKQKKKEKRGKKKKKRERENLKMGTKSGKFSGFSLQEFLLKSAYCAKAPKKNQW